ncbi:MAG: 16S rRNA (cytidine(1402)-2'-O)-methyltransferase [Candidatus Limnocylindrales bacterium]
MLFVVSTPIGNMGDMTLRGIEVLRSVAMVAAEDTRMTRRLWARHGIETRLVSYHAHSPERREAELLTVLEGGSDIALVTDAGTPLVSDPGEGLVRSWADRGGAVVPIPGASAVLAALVASALPVARWAFEGFLARRGKERRAELTRLAADDRASVLYEAPGRTAATLRDLAAACGERRRGAVCRELTKRHEETWRGTLGELATRAAQDPPRGEVTIVVAGADGSGAVGSGAAGSGMAGSPSAESAVQTAKAATSEALARVAALVASGVPRSAAAKQVAKESGLSRRALFAPRGRET